MKEHLILAKLVLFRYGCLIFYKMPGWGLPPAEVASLAPGGGVGISFCIGSNQAQMRIGVAATQPLTWQLEASTVANADRRCGNSTINLATRSIHGKPMSNVISLAEWKAKHQFKARPGAELKSALATA